jgi:hypothetical protein
MCDDKISDEIISNLLTLNIKMDKFLESLLPSKGKEHESACLNELYAALSKAQGAMSIALKDSANPFFKSNYSDLASIVGAAKECLAANGLSVIQRNVIISDKPYMLTRLCHSSGQWMESQTLIAPAKNDVQSLGSYYTYLRRYNFAMIVGVVSGDEDDDGEKAMDRGVKEEAKKDEPITPAQVRELEKMLFDLTEDDEIAMLNWCQVKELSEIPQSKFNGAKKALVAKIAAKKATK